MNYETELKEQRKEYLKFRNYDFKFRCVEIVSRFEAKTPDELISNAEIVFKYLNR